MSNKKILLHSLATIFLIFIGILIPYLATCFYSWSWTSFGSFEPHERGEYLMWSGWFMVVMLIPIILINAVISYLDD